MKIRKSFAGIAAGSLALTGLAVATAPAAQASSSVGNLYAQINNTALSGSVARGSQTITMTVSPASASVGTPIEILVSSSTLAFNNGPAATVAAGGSELDAVVSLNGVDYVLRGSQNTPSVAPNLAIFNTGWVVSSTAGNSSATSVGAIAASTGLGAAVRGAEGTPVALTMPASAGTYTIALKALVNNSIAGSGTAALTDSFDEITNADNTNAGGAAGTVGPGGPTGSFATNNPASYIAFSPLVTATAIGPNGSIVTSSGQNAAVQAVRMSAAYTSTVVLTGSVFGAAATVGQVTAQFCDVSGVSCVNPGYSDSNSLSVTGGALSGAILHVPGTPGPTTGNRAIKVVNTVDSSTALIPVLVLGTATVSVAPASFGPGATVSVTGSNFNPGQAVTVYGSTLASLPFTATGDAPVAAGNATATGALSATNFTVASGLTASVVAYQGIPGAPAASNPSGFQAVTINLDTCTRQVGTNTPTLCETKQNLSASVTAGALTQTAVAYASVGYTSTAIPMGTVTSAVSSQVLNGFLNPITVADARGGIATWSLTAAMPTITATAGTIANGNLAITGISCAGSVTSATGNTAGANNTFAGVVTLCTKNGVADSAGDTTGGSYLVNANLALTVPAFQAAGAYTSTITVTLT